MNPDIETPEDEPEALPAAWPTDVRKPLTEEEGRAVVAYVETLLEQLP